jgi:MSHA biogenesis protein MshE
VALDRLRFVAGRGCTYCNLTGYRGRVAVYELLEFDRGLADAVRCGDLDRFANAARASAEYVPLAQGAIDLALAGTTSLAEAMAVGSGLEEQWDEQPFGAREVLSESGIASLLGQ